MRKFIGIFALELIAVITGYIYWFYLKVYDSGIREGIVQKFSREGDVFKTYEGELLGGGFGRVGAGFQAQYFYFSVEDPEVANFIEQNAGKNLRLHYVRYKKSLPWRGKNYNAQNQNPGQYIVDKAEVSQRENTVPTRAMDTQMPEEEMPPIPY